MECSFCRKPQDDVAVFIVGPQVNICNECVMLCVEIIIKSCGELHDQNADLKNALHLAETL